MNLYQSDFDEWCPDDIAVGTQGLPSLSVTASYDVTAGATAAFFNADDSTISGDDTGCLVDLGDAVAAADDDNDEDLGDDEDNAAFYVDSPLLLVDFDGIQFDLLDDEDFGSVPPTLADDIISWPPSDCDDDDDDVDGGRLQQLTPLVPVSSADLLLYDHHLSQQRDDDLLQVRGESCDPGGPGDMEDSSRRARLRRENSNDDGDGSNLHRQQHRHC